MEFSLGPIMNTQHFIYLLFIHFRENLVFKLNMRYSGETEDFSLRVVVSNDENRECEPEEDSLRRAFPEKVVIVEQQSHICREEQNTASEG